MQANDVASARGMVKREKSAVRSLSICAKLHVN